MRVIAAARDLYNRIVWPAHFESLPAYRRGSIIALRIAVALVGDFRDGEITLRAMGLVYTTLVSLVPLLALAFSLLKAFGVDNALRPTLERFLSPLGSGREAIIDKVVDFVANVQVGVLGVIGVVALIYSVLSLIQKVEAGCNFIWQVQVSRPLGRRVTEYISVLVAGPLVILAAASVTASVGRNSTVVYVTQFEVFGSLIYALGLLLPYVLYSAAFTLLFKFMPNTRVHMLPALGGGIFAGVLWQTASVGFAVFAKNAGNVNAIYSSFAILILLLIWLYVSWMIVLLGCRVSFWLQHFEQLVRGRYPPRLGIVEAERLTLLITVIVADRYVRGDGATDAEMLAQRLGAAPEHVRRIIKRLIDARILIETVEVTDVSVVPHADADRLPVREILDVLRRSDPSAGVDPHADISGFGVDRLLDAAEHARLEAIGATTLRDLLDDGRLRTPTADKTGQPIESLAIDHTSR